MSKIIAFLALIALNTPVDTSLVSRQEVGCIATAVYHEARGETRDGQTAVAKVILNRMYSVHYPKTACEVVYQPHQFTDIDKAKPDYNSKAWSRAVEIAALTYTGLIDIDLKGATHYYAPAKVKPAWDKGQAAVNIGNHRFLRG